MKFSIEKVKFLASKHSPEIWLGAGVVMIIGGVVYACQKSRKIDYMVDTYIDDKMLIRDERNEAVAAAIPDGIEPDDVTVEDAEDADEQKAIALADKNEKKALLKLRCEYALEYARMYAPAVLMIGGGLYMVIYGHRILNKRNAALISAYATLEQAFNEYRDRVRTRYGENAEEDIFYNREYKTVNGTVEEDGKKKKVKNIVPVVGEIVSPYARFFDEESSKEYFKSFESNRTFLLASMNMANDKLHRDGFLLLNTVYEMLGLRQDPTGAICGWALDDEEGDTFVDFGIIPDEENNRFLLNFNCQGMVYDKIK